MKNDIKGGVITTPLFWDCECDTNYIHPDSHTICGECGVKEEEAPDSRVQEVLEWLHDLWKGGCLNGIVVKETIHRTIMWLEITKHFVYDAPAGLRPTEDSINAYLQINDPSWTEHQGITGIEERGDSKPGEKTAGELHEERYGEAGPNEGDGEEEDPHRYVVLWQIDVDAHDPREAARKALAMQKDPNSTATVFKVTGQLGDTHEIDLEEEEEEVTLEEVEEYLQDEWDNASGRERDIFEEALRIVRDSKP